MELYYKYLPPCRISYFENELLRFTQPADLNDPFECLPQIPDNEECLIVLQRILDILRVSKDNPILEKINAKRLFEEGYENINKEIGVFSLSKNWKNALMWAHYTESHSGFCLGFNPKHQFFEDYLSTDCNSSKTTKPVVYSRTRFKIPVPKSELTYQPFLTKSLDWQYEEEIRMIATLNLSTQTLKRLSLLPLHLFKVPHSAIAEIVLGARIEEKKENIITEFCQHRSIALYKATASDLNFDMERSCIIKQ